MKRHLKYFAAALMAVGCTGTVNNGDFTDYVDPKIGTGGHGHVFVGANVLLPITSITAKKLIVV